MISYFKKIFVAITRMIANHCIVPQLRHLLLRLSGLNFGSSTFINMGVTIIDDYENLIEIGDRVAISPNVTFVASSNPNHSKLSKQVHYVKKMKISVADDAWIGAGAVIMPGICIGKMSIVGSNAVVTKNVADYQVVAGIPAVVIGNTNSEVKDSM